MASEMVMAADEIGIDPRMHGAPPVLGNYTDDASEHLRCANALAQMVSSPELTFESWHADFQDAVRYLLSCETARARNALAAEAIAK